MKFSIYQLTYAHIDTVTHDAWVHSIWLRKDYIEESFSSWAENVQNIRTCGRDFYWTYLCILSRLSITTLSYFSFLYYAGRTRLYINNKLCCRYLKIRFAKFNVRFTLSYIWICSEIYIHGDLKNVYSLNYTLFNMKKWGYDQQPTYVDCLIVIE